MFFSSLPLSMATIIEREKRAWNVKEKQRIVVGDWRCIMHCSIYSQSAHVGRPPNKMINSFFELILYFCIK